MSRKRTFEAFAGSSNHVGRPLLFDAREQFDQACCRCLTETLLKGARHGIDVHRNTSSPTPDDDDAIVARGMQREAAFERESVARVIADRVSALALTIVR